MKLPQLVLGLVVFSAFAAVSNIFASLSIDSLNSPVIIDFNDFDGSGFSPTPNAGQLDSDMWAVDGLSDLSDGLLDFGETATNGDSARGISIGGATTGGIYAFDTGGGDIALGIQPIGSDWTPGSFTLRLQNNTGLTLTSIALSYSIYVYNDQESSNSFNFSHSFDDTSYTPITALNFESPEAADETPIWAETSLNTTLTGLSIDDGADYYLRWSGDDFSGSGSRDEFGLDNISLSAVPESSYFGLICGSIVLFVVGRRMYSLKSD